MFVRKFIHDKIFGKKGDGQCYTTMTNVPLPTQEGQYVYLYIYEITEGLLPVICSTENYDEYTRKVYRIDSNWQLSERVLGDEEWRLMNTWIPKNILDYNWIELSQIIFTGKGLFVIMINSLLENEQLRVAEKYLFYNIMPKKENPEDDDQFFCIFLRNEIETLNSYGFTIENVKPFNWSYSDSLTNRERQYKNWYDELDVYKVDFPDYKIYDYKKFKEMYRNMITNMKTACQSPNWTNDNALSGDEIIISKLFDVNSRRAFGLLWKIFSFSRRAMNYCLEPPLEGVEVEQFSKNYKVSITYRETLNGQDINKEIPINELENYVNYTALKINKVSDSSDYFYRYLKFDIIEPVGYTFTDELRITESAINTVYGDKVNGYVVRFTANISEDITSQRSKANDIYFNGTGLTGTELTIYQGYLERLRQTLIPYISKFSGDGLSETDLRTLYTDSHYNQKAAGVVDYSEFKYFAYSYVYGIYTFYDEKRKYNITKKNMLKDNRTLIPVLLDQIVIYDETTETYTYYPGDPSEEKKAEIWGNLYRLVGGNNLTINITTLPEYEPERYYCSELYNKQYLKLDGNRFTIQMSSTVPSASYLIKYDDNYENCDKVYVISNSRNIYLKPGSIQALYDLIKEGLPTKDYIASFNNLELIMLQDDREKLCTALEIEYSNVFITWVKYDYTENVDWKNAYIPYKLKKPEENNVFDKDYNEMLDEIDYHFSFDKHLSAWCGWKEPVYLNVDDYPPFDKNSCNIYISEVTSTGYKYGYYKKYKNMNGVENKKGVSINTITITTDAGEPPEIPENLQNMTQEDKDEWIGKYKQWIYNVNIKLNQRISSILPLMVMSIKVPITDLSATPFLYTQWYIDFYPASEIDKIVDYFLLEYDSTQWILNNLNVIKAICGTNKKNYDPGDHLKINNGIDVSRLKVGFNYDLAVYLPYIRREDMTAHKGETPNYIYFNGEEGLQNGEGRRNQLYQPLEGESESTGLVGRVSYFTNYLNNLRTSDDSNFNGNDYPENVTEVLNSLRELKPGRTGLYIYEDPLVIKNVNEGQNCHELVYDNNEQCYKFTYNSETYKVCYVPTQGVLYMIDKYPTSITTGEIKYLYNGYGSSTYVKFLRNDIGTIYNGFLSTGTLELTNQEIETLEKVKESYTRLSLLDNLDESNEEEYVKNFLKNTFAFYRTYDEEFCSYLGETSVSNMNTEIFNGSNFLESNSTITTSNGSYVYNLLYFDNNDKHVSALEVKLQIVTDARNSISTFILPDDKLCPQ